MDRSASDLPILALFLWAAALSPLPAQQQVCLPAPRLLTLTPMGGQRGTVVEVAVTGDHLEAVTELHFSAPGLTAEPVRDAAGVPVPDRFRITIAADAPTGIHDARATCRLGVSSARAFTVGTLAETIRTASATTPDTAFPLALNSVCNAAMTKRAVDFYSFQARGGQRIAVECAAAGIDSKLVPVLMVADARGLDLQVNRTGGAIDFTAPADGTYLIKVHSLTFQGGPEHFYRLVLQEVVPDAPLPRHPRTRAVGSGSWPPPGLPVSAALRETEPPHGTPHVQEVTLPLDLAGSFYPAADVDVYQFEARKGEVWWVELASERLGHPTDPFVVIQRLTRDGTVETLSDVVELADIPSPVKVSTNGYSYDGPPYDIGSPDVLGKFEAPADGTYRLQVRDLFGGTRAEPTHAYRLLIRPARPDFALTAWAVHMTLRNGDRNALSKPAALRAGASMAFEVVALRRDGFDGPIDLHLDGLPPGVTAAGLRIPAGKAVGTVVLSADSDAKAGFSMARLVGTADIGGESVIRSGHFASMQWPVRDAKQEIPKPRLLADLPVSVTDSEPAPVTIAPREERVWTARVGEPLTVPLRVDWKEEFTGGSLRLKAYGAGFEPLKEVEIPVQAGEASLNLDLAALKLPPGEHTLALYGTGVCRYRYNPAAVTAAEAERRRAEEAAAALGAAAKQLSDGAASAPSDLKPLMSQSAKVLADRHKTAEAAMTEATKRMKAASDAAAPKETADIVVSRPIRIAISAAP